MKAVLPESKEMSERELTPSEIRGVLLELARKRISESVARPAIDALNKIMCDTGTAAASRLAPPPPGKPGR